MAISTCAVTGNVKNLLNSGVQNCKVKVSVLTPFFHGTTWISGELGQVITNETGDFSVSVVETETVGQTVTFTFEYYDGVADTRKKTYTVVVPNQTTVELADIVAAAAAPAIVNTFPAASVTVAPISGLTATTGQAALAEHQVDIDTLTTSIATTATAVTTEAAARAAADATLQTDINTRATSAALTSHTGASTGVHGVTGAVVGTTDTQTLSGKGIDATTNTLTNIANAEIKAAAAIALNKLAATTASRALVSDGSGFVSPATTTSTEIGYVNGVTSAIQTQLDAKVAKSTFTTKGDILVASAASTPTRVGIGSDGQVPVADSSASTGLAWKTLQQGAKNYITYNSFENNATTGWSLCTVGAVDATTKAVSGSLTLSAASLSALATTATNPLAGTYSLQTAAATAWASAQGFCSQAYTIDREDLAKPMSFRGYFEVPTGSSLINCSGTTSNTFAVWLYDVTNSAWVQPAGAYSMTQLTGVGVIQGSFQLPSTCTSFRLVVVCVNTPTAGALTINWDDFSVGPVTTTVGSPVGDWTAYTPTLTSSGGGAITLNATGKQDPTGWWRRDGDSIEIITNWRNGTGGTPTGSAGTVQLSVPSGITLDTSKRTSGTDLGYTVGTASGYKLSSGSGYDREPTVAYSNGNLVVYFPASAASLAVADLLASSSAQYKVKFPVTGWSSSVTMSSDSDTRVVALRRTNTTATSLATGTNVKVAFDTAGFDTHGAWDATNTRYVAPVAGKYRAHGTVVVSASAAAYSLRSDIWVNGSTVTQQSSWKSGTASQSLGSVFDATVDLKAGDYIEIWANQSSGSTLTVLGDGTLAGTVLNIERLSGPAVVAASETVAAKYSNVGTIAVGTSDTIVVATTKEFDTHGTYASGVFTCPAAGLYEVSAEIAVNTMSSTTVDRGIYLSARKNSTVVSVMDTFYFQVTSVSIDPPVGGSTVIKCIAGDTLDVTVKRDVATTAANITASASATWVQFRRVG